MSEREERTIPIPIDNLDYTPNMLAGFTAAELGGTFAALFVCSATVLSFISHLVFGQFVFGFLLSILVSALGTVTFAKKAYRIKAGRPSYLMWVDVQRRVQNRGVFGIKIPMGLVKGGLWHTGSTKQRNGR